MSVVRKTFSASRNFDKLFIGDLNYLQMALVALKSSKLETKTTRSRCTFASRKKMTNAQLGPVYWLVRLSFRGWDKFLVNAVCCHATKTISLYHDPILSATRTIGLENIRFISPKMFQVLNDLGVDLPQGRVLSGCTKDACVPE